MFSNCDSVKGQDEEQVLHSNFLFYLAEVHLGLRVWKTSVFCFYKQWWFFSSEPVTEVADCVLCSPKCIHVARGFSVNFLIGTTRGDFGILVIECHP